jgi:hypothetical protein
MEQDLCLPLEDVNEEVLFSLIDRALQKDRTKLASAVEGLRAIEYKNRETARELLSNK